jgi:hypothetical protein
MNFPWTSRERLSEAQSQIAELKAEVKDLRAKNEKLINQIVWRQSSIALEPDLLPEQYRPKHSVPSTAKGDALNDPPKETPITGSGPSRVRATIRDKEKQLEAQFIRETTGSGGPISITADDRRAQSELLNKLNESANEGVKEAAAL